MPPTPDVHPVHGRTDEDLSWIESATCEPDPIEDVATAPTGQEEDGSLVAEYGLLAVLAATIAGLAIKWASGGAIFELLDGVLSRARVLVGM